MLEVGKESVVVCCTSSAASEVNPLCQLSGAGKQLCGCGERWSQDLLHLGHESGVEKEKLDWEGRLLREDVGISCCSSQEMGFPRYLLEMDCAVAKAGVWVSGDMGSLLYSQSYLGKSPLCLEKQRKWHYPSSRAYCGDMLLTLCKAL